jgi:hypothetical protein
VKDEANLKRREARAALTKEQKDEASLKRKAAERKRKAADALKPALQGHLLANRCARNIWGGS